MNPKSSSPAHRSLWQEGVQIRAQLRPVRTYREVGELLHLSESQVSKLEVMALAKVSRSLRWSIRLEDLQRLRGAK